MALRRSRIAGCVGLGALALTACGADDGGTVPSAACEPSHLEVAPATAARGEELTVSGTAFMDGCADSCSVDEDTGHQSCESASPHRAITVEIVPDDGPSVVLARVDADEDGAFTMEVTVPDDAAEGRASTTTDVVGSEPVQVTIAP